MAAWAYFVLGMIAAVLLVMLGVLPH